MLVIRIVVLNILCAHIISNTSQLAVGVKHMPYRKSSLLQRSDTLLWRLSLLLRLMQQVLKPLSLNTVLASRLQGPAATLRPTHIMEAVLKPSNYLLSRHMLQIMRATPNQLRRN